MKPIKRINYATTESLTSLLGRFMLLAAEALLLMTSSATAAHVLPNDSQWYVQHLQANRQAPIASQAVDGLPVPNTVGEWQFGNPPFSVSTWVLTKTINLTGYKLDTVRLRFAIDDKITIKINNVTVVSNLGSQAYWRPWIDISSYVNQGNNSLEVTITDTHAVLNYFAMEVVALTPQEESDQKNTALHVWWDPYTWSLQTDNPWAVVKLSPYESNTYYIGSIFSSAQGLQMDLSPNQSAVPAMSVVRAVLDQNYSVTCSSLSQGSMGGIYGVSGSLQKVNVIEFNPAGDMFVGGSFWTAGGFYYSYNIGCYRRGSGGGWNTSTWFSVNGEVKSIVQYPSSMLIRGTFTGANGPVSLCGSGSSLLNLPGQVSWHDGAPHGSFYCGYWQR